MKSKIIIILLAVGILYLGGRYIYYGSLTRNCIYTENKLAVPKQLTNGKIVVAKDAYIAVGIDREYVCLKNFGISSREIVGPETINNITIGRKYFTKKGLAVETLKKGVTFHIIGVVAVTKHGITTIDSGLGPAYYLILKDKNNILYHIATVSLGSNKEDVFLSFVDPSLNGNSSVIKLLSPDSFNETADYEGENSITYTGKLIELTNTYLENTEIHR